MKSSSFQATPGDAYGSMGDRGAQAPGSQDVLSLFMQHMPVAGAMLDRSFRYIMTSSRWVSDFDLERLEVHGHSHFDFFSDRDGGWHNVFEQGLNGVIQRGEEAPFRRKSGRTFWVAWEVRPWYTHEGDVGGIMLFTEDKTDAHVVQEELQTSRELLAGIMNSTLDGIMAFEAVRDATGRIVDFEWLMANPRSEDLTGRSPAYFVGKRLLEEMPGNRDAGLFDAYVRVVETGEPYESEFYYPHDGIEAWFRNTATRLSDGFAVIFRDITGRKEAEQQAARTRATLEQRNRELQEFAYVASHDLQEPLRKIRAFADLLREDYAGHIDETGAYYLERMQDAAERMATLISDLLAFSRVTTQGRPFRQVDLNKVLSDVQTDLEIAMNEARGRIDAEPLPKIEADPTQMRQLFQNLIGNALKFHRKEVAPLVQISSHVEADEVGDQPPKCHIYVTDNGIGFDTKYLDRIFSPFQRLHGRGTYAGTGMGLAICRRIVDRHGGTITAQSRPGAGATFHIVLPVLQSNEDTPS